MIKLFAIFIILISCASPKGLHNRDLHNTAKSIQKECIKNKKKELRHIRRCSKNEKRKSSSSRQRKSKHRI